MGQNTSHGVFYKGMPGSKHKKPQISEVSTTHMLHQTFLKHLVKNLAFSKLLSGHNLDLKDTDLKYVSTSL